MVKLQLLKLNFDSVKSNSYRMLLPILNIILQRNHGQFHANFNLTMCTKLQGMSRKLYRKETFTFFKKDFVTALNNLLQIQVFFPPTGV